VTVLRLPSLENIRRYARGALVAADCLHVVPTPLEEVATAANLLPAEDLFAFGEDIPPGLRTVLRKLMGRIAGALAVAERKIYLDITLPHERLRFTHGHEIGHQALPWHQAAYLGDDQYTLSPDTTAELEQEANAFSAELLFQLDRFTEQADDYAAGLAAPLVLAAEYHASAHAAIRRYVEHSRQRLGLLVLGRYRVHVSRQPALKVLPELCAQSGTFMDRYGPVTGLFQAKLTLADHPFAMIADTALQGAAQKIVTSSEATCESRRGTTRLQAEVFSNTRFAFVLLFPRPSMLSKSRLRIAS
jgi:IrrE N-terminal-like domain